MAALLVFSGLAFSHQVPVNWEKAAIILYLSATAVKPPCHQFHGMRTGTGGPGSARATDPSGQHVVAVQGLITLLCG